MSLKTSVMIGVFVGSIVGSYIPVFFGAGLLSYTSLIFTAIGGFFGMYVAYKYSNG